MGDMFMADGKDNENHDLDQEREELIRRYDVLDNEITTMRGEDRPFIHECLRKLIGPKLETMLESPEETLASLLHVNPSFRRAALYLLESHWGLAKKHAQQIEQIALADQDREVRELALGNLGLAYAHTKEPRLAHLLAGMVLNDSLEDTDRVAAFRALVLVYGLSSAMDDGVRHPFAQRLDDVDWEFAKRWLFRF